MNAVDVNNFKHISALFLDFIKKNLNSFLPSVLDKGHVEASRRSEEFCKLATGFGVLPVSVFN
jgi:hypothetical protein